LVLLIVVCMASVIIIVVNYYTIKVLSGTRAYINGESEYSKAQKDASAYLINYIYLENDSDYASYKEAISVNIGDRIARNDLLSGKGDYQIAKKGFLQGKNHPVDIDNLVWLFDNFKHLAMFKKAILIWTDADAMISTLNHLSLQADQKINAGKISSAEKKSLILAINNISQKLTIKEDAFSDTLGTIACAINSYVFIANVMITLVIIFSSFLYAALMIRNLANSNKKIIEQNDNLQVINAGLDKFVYNVTHDLRSPLASLVGLIGLIDEEIDPRQIKKYTLMMKDSLEKQDRFIHEMLTFIKSKDTGLTKADCSLKTIVEDVIAQNKYRDDGKAIKFYKELELNNIESDALKLQVILNNLVSNAIKYRDKKKADQWVKVKTYRLQTNAVIEVEDNGVGIRPKDQERIFDKFYLLGDNKISSGIGLYLVKDAVNQMNGKIEVVSEPGISSKFRVSFPN
jgi:signal transduction histidine kinase